GPRTEEHAPGQVDCPVGPDRARRLAGSGSVHLQLRVSHGRAASGPDHRPGRGGQGRSHRVFPHRPPVEPEGRKPRNSLRSGDNKDSNHHLRPSCREAFVMPVAVTKTVLMDNSWSDKIKDRTSVLYECGANEVLLHEMIHAAWLGKKAHDKDRTSVL